MNAQFRIAFALAALFAVGQLQGQRPRTPEAQLKAAHDKAEFEGDLKGAIELYKNVAQDKDRALAARALVRMGEYYEKLGQGGEARKSYERVVREFANQGESVSTARTRLAAMQSASAARVGQTARLLWSDPRLSNTEPGPISADGRYLIFPADGLTIIDLKAGKTKTIPLASLGDKGYWVNGAAISPDGRQVAYSLVTDEGFRSPLNLTLEGRYEVRVLQVNGGKAAKSKRVYLSPVGEQTYPYGWTPDGKKVLVQRDGNQDQNLTVVSIADGSIRDLPQGRYELTPFSPDGRLVAYSRWNTGNATDGLFVATMDGTETRIDVGPGQNRGPIWSHDGSHLLFESNRTGTWSLWMAPVAGGTPIGPARLVKENLGPYSPLGFTREGALHYMSGRATTTVYTVQLDARLNATAAPAMVTNQYINSNRAGVWSPDGQNLAYLSVTERGVFIRVRSAKTGEDREVPTLTQASGPVRWFPDGQTLLVPSRDARALNGNLGYYRVNIANGNVDLLHQTVYRNVVSTRPDLSPDGKTIFYLETPRQPMRFDIDSRRETKLTPVGDRVLSLAVSPNGAQVAYLNNATADEATSLVVAPATGGEPREVIRLLTGSQPSERAEGYGLAWSPDQRYLFFVPGSTGGIWRVPVAGGEAENIGVSMGRIRALRVHPDGRRVAFDSVVDEESEVWALENFLPKTGGAR